jgi:hypothetical protein
MQQHAALEQRKSCLPVGTALDPFDFVDEALNHPVVPRLAASKGDRLCIIGQSIDKIDEFRDATGLDGGFPVIQSLWAFPLPKKLPKRLSQGEGSRDRGIVLAESIKERDLPFCSVIGRSNHHQRDTASGGRFSLQRLPGDTCGPPASELLKDPPHGTQRSGIPDAATTSLYKWEAV